VVQREVPAGLGDGGQPRPCPHCRAPLRVSHRTYAGAGSSTVMLRCTACGHSVTGATRSDAERGSANRGRSRRHQPVDEGPPTNPVIDREVARRLLEELGG
jgi:predicted Zn finger-like uncharacterized protein